MMGTNLNISLFEPEARHRIALQMPQPFGDYLDLMMTELNLYLNTLSKANLPSVYYVHCIGGKDRTSEVSAAYYMQ